MWSASSRCRTSLYLFAVSLVCLAAAGHAQEAPKDPFALVKPASAGHGPSFLSVEVGRSTMAEVNSALGPATFVDDWTVRREGTELLDRNALASVTVHFTPEKILSWLEFAPSNSKFLLDATLALSLKTLPSSNREAKGRRHLLWGSMGIELVTEEGMVVVVRLVAPPSTAAAKPPPAKTTERIAHVERVWLEHDIEWKGQSAVKVNADLIALGLPGERLEIGISFHDQKVRELLGPDSEFAPLAAREVPNADWSWKPFQYAVPYGILTAGGRPPDDFRVRVMLKCGGLMSWAEAGVARPNGKPVPAITLASVEMGTPAVRGTSSGTIVLPGRPTPTGPDVGGMGVDPRQPPAPLEPNPPTVICGFQVDGCGGQALTVVLGLRTPDGAAVKAKSGAPPTSVGPDGVFQIVHHLSAIDGDRASVATPPIALPLGHLDLPAGARDGLLLTITGICGHVCAGRWQPLDAPVAATPTAVTSLHAAAAAGDEKLVAELLAGGADPRVRNEDGDRPVDFADRPAIRQMLADATERLTAPHRAAIEMVVSGFLSALARGDREAVRRFLTPEEAARLPSDLRQVAMESRIAGIELDIDTATAVVSMKAPGKTSVGDRFRMTVNLTLTDKGASARWLISNTMVEPGEVR